MYSTYLMFKNQIQSRARLVNNTLTVLYSCRFKQIQKLQLLALFALWKFSNSRAYILDLESKLVNKERHITKQRKSSKVISRIFSQDYVFTTKDSRKLFEKIHIFSVFLQVWVGGTKPGRIDFLGETKFAPGEWAGVVLDEPVGKNDGSVGGVSYFKASVYDG